MLVCPVGVGARTANAARFCAAAAAQVADQGEFEGAAWRRRAGRVGRYVVSVTLFLNLPAAGASQLVFLTDTETGRRFPGGSAAGWVVPAVGRMVAFSSGPENVHAVTDVKPPTPRITLNLWLAASADAELSEAYRAALGLPAV